MDTSERIELLEEARGLLEEVVDKIAEAVDGTDQANGAEAYVIPSLKMCLGGDHEYMGSQPYNIEELIESINSAEDEKDEEKYDNAETEVA